MVCACLLLLVAAPEPALVYDFTTPPLYAFLSWDKCASLTTDGWRVTAKDAKGGAGVVVQADLTGCDDWSPLLTVTLVSPAKALRATLDDADGTSHDYWFDTTGVPAGQRVTLTARDGASVREPSKVAADGKVAGLDTARITGVKVTGDWAAARVDLVVHRLEVTPPTPAILAQRDALRQKLAAEAERLRQAAEEKATRVAALLAGAPHPADGPNVQWVALVSPEWLTVRVQEKVFQPAGQLPYEPQDGDELKRSDQPVWVVEDGEVKQAEKHVEVLRQQGRRKVSIGDLAVNAKMLKPEDTATGADLSVDTVDNPSAYRIVGVDDPAWTTALEPATVAWKRKPNGYRSLTHQVDLYLKLPRPLAVGKTYRVSFVGVNLRQESVDYRHAPDTTRSPAIHVGAIGFRPDDPLKRAWLSQWLGTGGPLDYTPGTRFSVLDDATGRVAFEGEAAPVLAADGEESFKSGRNYSRTAVYALDFATLTQPGRYRVCVDGVGCSYPFEIAADVWQRAFVLSMQGLLAHRSGLALGPPETDYVRPRPMHPADGVRVFGCTGSELDAGGQDGAFQVIASQHTDELLPQAWGGHMDAGDWDRNGNHEPAFWQLLDLFELVGDRIGQVALRLPDDERRNGIPDLLDEALWSVEFYARLQRADGGVGGGIESTSHPRPGEASWQESLLLAAFAPDPQASYYHAAVAGKLARLLQPYDTPRAATLAASATRAWEWAESHREAVLAGLPEARQRSVTEALTVARNLAALELWLSTGQATLHDTFTATTFLSGRGDPMKQLDAVVRYARLPDGQGDAALRQQARDWILTMADTALKFGDSNAFGITTAIPQLPPMGYVGYLSVPEMIGAVLPHAWLLTQDDRYLAGAVRACQFASGANPENRAWTTGLGPDPVRFPLHIDSQITGRPAPPGITVYGVSDPLENYGFDAWAYTWYLQKMVPPPRTWPANEMYWDIGIVPSTNEYTIHQTILPTACYWGFLAAR